MADKYVPIFYDWIEATQELNAQEKGRLIDAIVLYARGDDWQEQIKGNERYAFPLFKLQVDRAKDISDARANARKNKSEQNEQNESKKTNDNKTPNNNNNNNKNNNNNEYKNKDNHHDDDAHEDDVRLDTVEAYASGNLQHMSPGNLFDLAGFLEDLPEELVRHAIDVACGNGAPRWAYVQAILRGYLRDGIRTVGDAKAAEAKRGQGGKTALDRNPEKNPALNYQQREYTEDDFEDIYMDMDYYAKTGEWLTKGDVKKLKGETA